MIKQKRLFVSTLALAVLVLAGVASVSSVKADDETYRPIITRLAEKFNLDEEEVKKVFDEERADRYAKRQAGFEEMLDQAVLDGKITEDQKLEILALHTQLEEERENRASMTFEERKEAMEQHHEAMLAWQEENDIDLHGLLGQPKFRGHHGPEM